jgi:alkylated DNA repair protein alkB homolog 7
LSACTLPYFPPQSRRYERGHWDAVITDYKEVELEDASLEEPDTNTVSIPDLLQRIRDHLGRYHLSHKLQGDDNNSGTLAWLPCHGIDLKMGAELNAHVDSIKFSGDLVAGLSLLTPSIMRLRPAPPDVATEEEDEEEDRKEYTRSKAAASATNDEGCVDLYLPPRSLYALTGVCRYRYTHELLPSGSTFLLQQSAVPLGTTTTAAANGDGNDANVVVVERGHRLSIIFRDAK